MYLKRFDEIQIYSDPGSQNQTCRDVLPEGVVEGVSIGYNILEGPGRVGTNVHTSDQAFVVVEGRGTLVIGERRIPLEAQMIVVIPAGVPHDTVVGAGERIEYVYVNNQ